MTETVKRLMQWVHTAKTLEQHIAQLEAALKAEQNALASILEERIPDAFDELCQEAELDPAQTYALPDGTQLKVERSWHGFITEDNKQAAMDWLHQQKLASLIKTRVTVEFGKNERNMALRFAEVIRGSVQQYPVTVVINDDAGEEAMLAKIQSVLETVVLGREIKVESSLHSSTLKALVKQQFKAGNDWPAHLFSAFEKRSAHIKAPECSQTA